MYTQELATQLSELLTQDSMDDFFAKLREESEQFEPFVTLIEEEWRKLQIAKKNGLMNDEQVYFAISAFFTRESKRYLQDQTSDS